MAPESRAEVVHAISDLLDSHCKVCEAKTEHHRKYGGNTSFITHHCSKCPIGIELADLGKRLGNHVRSRKKISQDEQSNSAKLPDRDTLLSLLAAGKTLIQIEDELDLTIGSLNYRVDKWGLRGITPAEAAGMLEEPSVPRETKRERKKTTMEKTITKEQYLARRLDGEKRTNIVRSMGVPTQKAYNMLKEWGIKEIDAEERELEIYAAGLAKATPEPIPAPVSDGADLAGQLEPQQDDLALLQEELQQEREAHGRCMQQADDFAASLSDRDRLVAELRSKVADRDSRIADLEAEVDRLRVDAVTADSSDQRLLELQAEYKRLEAKFQDVYLANIDLQKQAAGFIQLRLPVIPADGPNVQRAMIYELIETLNKSVEPAVIERGDIMLRMFELLQQMVAFVTADMAELLPGQDLTVPAQRFFEYHNARYIQATAVQKEVS